MILRGACICNVAVSSHKNEIASAIKLPRKIIITYSFATTQEFTKGVRVLLDECVPLLLDMRCSRARNECRYTSIL
jgi:hypothetical protein